MFFPFVPGAVAENEPRTESLLMTGSGFSTEELDRIREIGDSFVTQPVRVWPDTSPKIVTDRRVSATGAHFPVNDDTRWIYDRLAARAQEINAMRFGYDLTGFGENFYYLSYEVGQFFGWHLDQGPHTASPRKLSLSLQLSDESEYEGGDLEIMGPTGGQVADRGKGLIAAFPAHKIHRVTPVTRGKRRALAIFTSGPCFR